MFPVGAAVVSVDYAELQRRWKQLRGRGDLTVREVACEGAARTLLCVEYGERHAPSIQIAAGVHGDEPAGALALVELAERAELDPRFAYKLWPCTNPSGFEIGCRENAEGIDVNRSFGRGGATPEARALITANRDRKFVLSIDLHEDDTCSGFYVYEYGAHGCGAAAIAAVSAAGFPADEDVLHPDAAHEMEAIGGLSFTLAMSRRAAHRALTFETPVCLPLAQRVEIHRIAVKAAIAALSNLEHHG